MNDTNHPVSELFSKTVFVAKLSATDKPGVLAEIADAAVREGMVAADARDAVLSALMEREGKMSTGMQNGVAIPHAKTDLVKELSTMIALAPQGVPFDSMDGEPANIFIATLSPPDDANSHIRFLARVSNCLANRRVRDKVLAATTKDELVAAFAYEA